MPDHLHLLVEGLSDSADCKSFIRAAKQYAAYYFSRQNRAKLWERYCLEHILRDDFERATTIGYIVQNPVAAGLASSPCDYPYLGSQRYTLDELVEQSSAGGGTSA